MWTWIRSLLSGGRSSLPRSAWDRRAILNVEQLDERIVPTVVGPFDRPLDPAIYATGSTVWTDATGDKLWSTAGNWSGGLPGATKVAIFNPTEPNGSNDNCNFGTGVLDANRIVAGLDSSAGGYSGTLSLVSGKSLTISSNSATITGFRWKFGNISQGSASDFLVISGGGSATTNVWNGGTINSNSTQSNLYINGASTLRITEGASALGDNIVIGQDRSGGSTLEFYNQTSTLQVNNNSGIQVSDDLNSETPRNQLLFDTDVTQLGKVSKGLATTSADSFIDNFGVITRSNAGRFETGLPIKNEAGTFYGGKLDLQSDMWVSGQSVNKTANVSVDQLNGETILENGATLDVAAGLRMDDGQLLTYGGGQAIITADAANVTALDIRGGTIELSADNNATYGSLLVNTGVTSWTGGTFQAYVNGTDGSQGATFVTQALTLGAGAHLNVTARDGLSSGLTWGPISASSFTGTLSFDAGNLYNIAYGTDVIAVTSK